MLHCGVIRQSVNLKKIYQTEEELLRNEDRGLVRFRFMYSPEYIKLGLTILLREGRTKILGTITRLVPDKELIETGVMLNEKEMTKEAKKEIREGGRRKDRKHQNKEPVVVDTTNAP
jgi:hypothetical protein